MTAAVEGHAYFSEAIANVLRRTPIKQWSAYAILLDGETAEARLMPRGAMVSWLKTNDLPTLAHEAGARKVPEGAILVLSLSSEGPRFRVMFDPRKESAR